MGARGKIGLIGLLIALRVFNALSIKTFFQPDEYWQSLEPAHKLVYGYGYLTWEWVLGLRSIVHPLIFAGVYRAAEWFQTSPGMMILAPKIFQGIMAAMGDFYLYKLGYSMGGNRLARISLLLNLFSAFNWYCMTRTFSNSLEMILTTTALAYWPSNRQSAICWRKFILSLSIAAFTCLLRPTNGIIWVILGTHLLVTKGNLIIIFLVGFIGSLFLIGCAYLDRWYYGSYVFPLYKFLQFNIVDSLSVFYGRSPWHYYLTQGLPLLLIGYVPLTLIALWNTRGRLFNWVIVLTILIYSLISHKEVRFIYPLLPFLHLITAQVVLKLYENRAKFTVCLFVIIIILNMSVGTYLTSFHQAGVISVVDYIRTNPNGNIRSVGFLMPCHSTPWQSHIHRADLEGENMWFLTCEPPISVPHDERGTYLDEADQFYKSPVTFLKTHLPQFDENHQLIYTPKSDDPFRHSVWPSHLVMFEAVLPQVEAYVTGLGYREEAKIFNSHFHDDPRRIGDVVIYQML
ncbi:hypothetical protein NADFUDRAFT_42918 [Nadsonia fulvescens var. elongata DSM 6958]|uniref:Mannosyltransferase n=1 Tax=Nadsonia fulvescens var. elongata DSM 6958 TaxID=857566 RepID=A0A1E3PGT9_9ASCO|nr:hypothetical protein NADFUDRAFT_42918 [Nadsonia fulvescens var. elongata DSM 6958]